jgi:toxin HigB-1
MEFVHTIKNLQRLDEEAEFDGGFPIGVVKAFRRRMQAIRSAANENDLRDLKFNHFEKLKRNRKGQYSIRLNDQFRLIFEIEETKGGNRLAIREIADYH